jgi:hypothetical protein
MQQCAVYILYFTANSLYMFRVSFTAIIMNTENCSPRPLVQVLCRVRLDGVASPWSSQDLSLDLTMVKCVSGVTTDTL